MKKKCKNYMGSRIQKVRLTTLTAAAAGLQALTTHQNCKRFARRAPLTLSSGLNVVFLFKLLVAFNCDYFLAFWIAAAPCWGWGLKVNQIVKGN